MTMTAMKSERGSGAAVVKMMMLMTSIEDAAARAKESRTESSFEELPKLRGLAKLRPV